MSLGRVTIPSSASFQQTAKILNDLVGAVKPNAEAIKNTKGLLDGMHDVTRRVKSGKKAVDLGNELAKEANARAKELRDLGKEATKQFKKVNSLTSKFNKFFNPINKALGSQAAQKIIGSANFIMGVAGVAGALGNFWVQDQISEATQSQIRIVGKELGTNIRILTQQNNRLKILERREAKNAKDLDSISKSVGELRNFYNSQLNKLNIGFASIKKQANDALYEVRAGRKILNNQLSDVAKKANDSLYETRKGREILDGKIGNLSTRVNKIEVTVPTIDKKANEALYETRAGRKITDSKIDSVNKKVSDLFGLLAKNGQSGLSDFVKKSDFPGLIQGNIFAIANSLRPEITKLVNGKISEVRRDIDKDISQKIDKGGLLTQISQQSSDIVRVLTPGITAIVRDILSPNILKISGIEKGFDVINGGLTNLATNLSNLRRDYEKFKNTPQPVPPVTDDAARIDISDLKRRVTNTENKLIETDKVNKEGNRKLDDINKILLGIGSASVIAQAVATKIGRPPLPTPCRFNSDEINTHTTAESGFTNARMEAYNIANVALGTSNNAIANTINGKLGDAVPGGLGGVLTGFVTKFDKFSKWLHLDRVFNVLILMSVMHNAYMLSNNLTQTLFSIVDNIGNTFFKDADGEEFNSRSIVGGAIDEIMQGLFGVEEWKGMKLEWVKYNRVYQATANMLGNIQSMINSIYNIFDVIGNRISKIGNALRWFGNIADNAYSYMNQNNKFGNPVIDRITVYTEAADTLQTVTSEVLNIRTMGDELKKNREDLLKSDSDVTKKEDGLEKLEKDKNIEPLVKDKDIE
jgi:hypothetical protein